MGNFGRDDRGGRRSFGGGRGGFGGGRGGFGGDRGGSRGGFGGGRDGGRREMFSAVCSECHKECQVPFNPTNGKPVYCSECFEKINGGRDSSRRPERTDFRPQGGYDQSKIQLEAINVKLDKILAILAPAPIVKEEKKKALSFDEFVNGEKKEDSTFEKETEIAKPKKVKKVASKKKE